MNSSGLSRRSQRRRPIAEINVVPYIDVSLVLLIIFMVTAPMLQTGVDVDLPQAEARNLDPNEQLPIIISVKADGSLFLDEGNQVDTPAAENELPNRVSRALNQKPGLSVLIRGDTKVDYGRVVAIMAALKQAGLKQVGLMTRPAND